MHLAVHKQTGTATGWVGCVGSCDCMSVFDSHATKIKERELRQTPALYPFIQTMLKVIIRVNVCVGLIVND